ncbi:MAG TPA: hypothetical protein VIO61_08250 [Anaerolineaceae bacterium]
MQTEFDFVLPRGFIDAEGNLHRVGRMRLSQAVDEIAAVGDPRVQENDAYLPVILLSRVIVQLGTLNQVTPQVIESLFSADLAYLEDIYLRINSHETTLVDAVCPQCGRHFHLQVAPLAPMAD